MRRHRLPCALIAGATVIRILLATVVPLFPDETYYWEWSRHLAAGYFDHPPAIALLIRAGTTLLGDTRIGVRIGAILVGLVTSSSLVVLARRLVVHPAHADRAGVRAALLAVCIPIALVGFVLATPDAPLLAAVAVMLVAVDRALATPAQSRDALQWWCAAGVMLGAGLCSKYTVVLVPFGVLCAMVLRPSLRVRFREPGPYVATLLAVVIFAPVLLWNAQHHWISFAFQVHHGLGHHTGAPLTREWELLGGQLGLISPILAVLAGIAVVRTIRHPANDRQFAMAVIAATIALFFVVSALRKPVEANWPAPMLLAAIPVLATWDMRTTARRWFQGGVALAAACTMVIGLHAWIGILPLKPRRDPIARAYGWGEAAAHIESVRDTIAHTGTCAQTWIAADRYQDASELAFHLRGRPQVFALNLGGRANQYDLWPTLWTSASPADCFVLVVDDAPSGLTIAQRVARNRGAPQDAGVVSLRHGNAVVGRRHVWVVR